MKLPTRYRWLRALALVCTTLLLAGMASEVAARGRGGGGGGGGGLRGGGGMRGGGGYRGGGGVSRGGPARGGSVRYDRSGGGYRSYEPRSRGATRRTGEPGTTSRDGSFETRRGETVDWTGTVARTPEGVEREGSWESSSGASGSGSSRVEIDDGRVQGRERSGHVENADGETMDREVRSERHGDHVDREGEIHSSTGIDAEHWGQIKKTDDGFVARGAVAGKDGAAAGTVVRDGNRTRARGVASDGDHVSWGGVHCNGSHCYGGRATVKVDDYYRYPYYYYPYYYGWYSCPYGSVQTWTNRYGTPVYGCANVVVVHTTIALGETSGTSTSRMVATDMGSADRAGDEPREAEVSSAPVLMYEIDDERVGYSSSYAPAGVPSRKSRDRFWWVPGPAEAEAQADEAIDAILALAAPTANATVITYAVDGRTVYLTNERPLPGYYSETADQLFVWIPGVRLPDDRDEALLRAVIDAQRAGGKRALDREVRKLEADHPAPPDAATASSAADAPGS